MPVIGSTNRTKQPKKVTSHAGELFRRWHPRFRSKEIRLRATRSLQSRGSTPSAPPGQTQIGRWMPRLVCKIAQTVVPQLCSLDVTVDWVPYSGNQILPQHIWGFRRRSVGRQLTEPTPFPLRKRRRFMTFGVDRSPTAGTVSTTAPPPFLPAAFQIRAALPALPLDGRFPSTFSSRRGVLSIPMVMSSSLPCRSSFYSPRVLSVATNTTPTTTTTIGSVATNVNSRSKRGRRSRRSGVRRCSQRGRCGWPRRRRPSR